MDTLFTPAAQKELDQLLTVVDHHVKTGWMGMDEIDDQHKLLTLAYLMQALDAKYVKDVLCTVVVPSQSIPSHESTLISLMVYGLEVVTDGRREFVGVNGERTRFRAEQSVVERHAKGVNNWRSPLWEECKVVFPSLQAARRFYSKEAIILLERSVGASKAHLEVLAMNCPDNCTAAPRSRF